MDTSPTQSSAHQPLDYAELARLMAKSSAKLLRIAQYFHQDGLDKLVLTRPLLSVIQAEATHLEEFLDACGARTNKLWLPFRVQIAALKNFSTAGYELLHIYHAIPDYQLSGLQRDFAGDTHAAIDYVSCSIACALQLLLEQACRLGISPAPSKKRLNYHERLPKGRLPRNCQSRRTDSVQERITHLATSFLHRTEDARFLAKIATCNPSDFESLDFGLLNEASLRELESKIHNLQSLYDTYIGDSHTEDADPDLRCFRGHSSAALHLTRVTTIFIHFYERHIKNNREHLYCRSEGCCLEGEWFFTILTKYLAYYSYAFLETARDLCKQMLSRYAEMVTREIPVPPFIGFHMRPSMLVAAIVRHYGSNVSILSEDGSVINACSAFAIQRSNERINQLKRDYIFDKLHELDLSCHAEAFVRSDKERAAALRAAIMQIASTGLLKLYASAMPIEEELNSFSGSFYDALRAIITAFQRIRVLDVNYDVSLPFHGDRRVLEDIEILAKNGYGETDRGVNIPLPKELDYLRHSRP
jgi:hypothetical protein